MKNYKQWREEQKLKENRALMAGLMMGAAAAPSLAAAPRPAKVVQQTRLSDSQRPNEKAIGEYLNKKMIDATIAGKTMTFSYRGNKIEIKMDNNQLSDIIRAVQEAFPKLGIDGQFNIGDIRGFKGSTETTPSHKFDPSSTHDTGLRPYTFKGGSDAARNNLEKSQLGIYR